MSDLDNANANNAESWCNVIPLPREEWERAPVQLDLFNTPNERWHMELKQESATKDGVTWVSISDAQKRLPWWSERTLRRYAEEQKHLCAEKRGDRWWFPQTKVDGLVSGEIQIDTKPRGGNKRHVEAQSNDRQAATG